MQRVVLNRFKPIVVCANKRSMFTASMMDTVQNYPEIVCGLKWWVGWIAVTPVVNLGLASLPKSNNYIWKQTYSTWETPEWRVKRALSIGLLHAMVFGWAGPWAFLLIPRLCWWCDNFSSGAGLSEGH